MKIQIFQHVVWWEGQGGRVGQNIDEVGVQVELLEIVGPTQVRPDRDLAVATQEMRQLRHDGEEVRVVDEQGAHVLVAKLHDLESVLDLAQVHRTCRNAQKGCGNAGTGDQGIPSLGNP